MFPLANFLYPGDTAFMKDDMKVVENYYLFKYSVALLVDPQSILEIGVRAGYSAAAFLSACPTILYYGVDADNGMYGGLKGCYLWAVRTLPKQFPEAKIQISILDTQEQEPEGKGFGLAHIDGDHSYKGCLHDLRLVQRLQCKWALVDDITHHADTVGLAVKHFLAETGLPHLYFDTWRGDCLIRMNPHETVPPL